MATSSDVSAGGGGDGGVGLGVNEQDVVHHCAVIGTTYMIWVTCSHLNVTSILCADVFKLEESREHTYGAHSEKEPPASRQQEKTGDSKTNNKKLHAGQQNEADVSKGCVLFGIACIYISTIVMHLGPTIIAGQLDMNVKQDLFFCHFIKGILQLLY